MRKLLLSLLAAATICPGATGRIDPAGRARLDSIIASHPGVTGVAMIAGDDTVTAGSTARLPLMSIFKLHIAIAALRSGLPIDSTVNMTTAQLRTDTYSPLRDSIGTAPARLTVDELMHYSVCRSDNNACDRLIELAGGIEKVDSIVRSLGITDFCLTRTEDEMHERISRSYDNVSTPLELCRTMALAFDGTTLSPDAAHYLQGLLARSTTGRDKIYSGVDPGRFLGHKSGMSDRDARGVRMASGDAGAVMLPDGTRAFIAILVKDSPEADERTAALFRDITRELLSGR